MADPQRAKLRLRPEPPHRWRHTENDAQGEERHEGKQRERKLVVTRSVDPLENDEWCYERRADHERYADDFPGCGTHVASLRDSTVWRPVLVRVILITGPQPGRMALDRPRCANQVRARGRWMLLGPSDLADASSIGRPARPLQG